MPHIVLRIAGGEIHKKHGNPYNPNFLEKVWKALWRLNLNPDLEELLDGVGKPDLARIIQKLNRRSNLQFPARCERPKTQVFALSQQSRIGDGEKREIGQTLS